MLSTLLQQFVTSSNTEIYAIQSLLSTTRYTYYNGDMGIYLTAIVNTPFKYNSEQLLKLVDANVVAINSVTFSPKP